MEKAGKKNSSNSFKSFDEEKLSKVIPLMLDADNDDWPEHQGLKRQLFGFEGSIKHDVYSSRMVKAPCKWVLSSTTIRKRMQDFTDEATIDALNE
tara:strand:- start:106 stop:390 length:285 start_codon:yes stop_codon:yes gene_type:complete